MKRISSLIIALLMVFPLILNAIPANAADALNIDEVYAKYFDVKPFIDGYISEAEWGEPTVLAEQTNATTVGGQTPVPNRFFATANGGGYDAAVLKMSYMLWLRWDESYFYIGAKVNDPDGHSLRNSRSETWDGDALQVRIDPEGANGVCFGMEFYPEDFPNRKPWSADAVCDLVFGYCLNAGGYKEAWNNTGGVNKGMLTNSAYTQSNGFVDLAVAPAGVNYTTDTADGVTTYEVAIPWAYIEYSNHYKCHEYYKFAIKKKTDPDGKVTQGPDGAVGRELGMSAVVFNADGASDGDSCNALLTWGSGIASVQHTDESYKTCAGSNAVILVADKVSEDGAYNAGFRTYTKGGYVSPVVPPTYDFKIDPDTYVHLTYDNEIDMTVLGTFSNGVRTQLDDGNWVVAWQEATDRDHDEWDPEFDPEEPSLNTYNYISTGGVLPDGSDAGYVAEDCSFTFEFDMMVTGLENFVDGYEPAIYNWFGGTSSVDYQCGYFFDDGKFKIVNTNDPSEVVAEVAAELTLNEWHHWVFQYDDYTCTLRLYLDPVMIGDRISPSAKPIINLWYRYFSYGSIDETTLILRRMNAQLMLDNVKMYNFVDFSAPLPIPHPIPEIHFTFDLHDSIPCHRVVTGYIGDAKDIITLPYSEDPRYCSTVVEVADEAFKGIDYVKEFRIPGVISTIGDGAFTDCILLERILLLDDGDIDCPDQILEDADSFVSAELTETGTVTCDLSDDRDKITVVRFTPEESGFYNIGARGNTFDMIWVLDENKKPLSKASVNDYDDPSADRSRGFDLVEGSSYYVVLRSFDPTNLTDSALLVIENSPLVFGDSDCDGEITVADVLHTRRYMADIEDDGQFNRYNADVNEDGEVTVADILLIRKYLGGLISELPL